MKFFRCLYLAIKQSIDYDGVEHAGYMAFMVVLSLFPFLVFFLSLTSFFGASELGQNLLELIIKSSPESIVESLKNRLEELRAAPPNSLLNLAIFGTIWTASSFVEGLRTILNRIFNVKSPPPYIMRRLLSIVQFVLLCFILIIVMFIFVFVPALLTKLNIEGLVDITNKLVISKQIFVFISIFLCVLGFYIFIPNTKLTISKMAPGALVTAFSWQVSGFLLSTYIKYYHQLSLVYGSLGSIIVTLLFFYIINYLFIIGAAFNYQLSIYKSNKTTI